MGKVKPRILGLEDIEEKQKKEQKVRSEEKKLQKKKTEEKSTDVENKTEKVVKKEAKSEKKSPVKKIEAKVRGKKYNEAKKMVDVAKLYKVNEAIDILKKIKKFTFDESVELHMVVDTAGLKGEVELPFSTGKTVRIAVVDNSLIEKLEKGIIDFDVLITHPSFMPKLAKFAKVLGPRGLMPNPKAGTISPTPDVIVKKFQKGVLRWKTEAKFPLVHQMIGKISFDEKSLTANANKFIESVGIIHIIRAYVKTTMSPSIKLEIKS